MLPALVVPRAQITTISPQCPLMRSSIVAGDCACERLLSAAGRRGRGGERAWGEWLAAFDRARSVTGHSPSSPSRARRLAIWSSETGSGAPGPVAVASTAARGVARKKRRKRRKDLANIFVVPFSCDAADPEDEGGELVSIEGGG